MPSFIDRKTRQLLHEPLLGRRIDKAKAAKYQQSHTNMVEAATSRGGFGSSHEQRVLKRAMIQTRLAAERARRGGQNPDKTSGQ